MDYSTKLIAYYGYNEFGALDLLYRMPTREEARTAFEQSRLVARLERAERLLPGWRARVCWSADPEDRE